MPRGRPSTDTNNEIRPAQAAAVEKPESQQLRIRLNLRKKEPSPNKAESSSFKAEDNKENVRSPKITLSVRKHPSELPQITNPTPVAQPSAEKLKVGRPRGRPPKYPRPEGYVPTVKKTDPLFTRVPKITESTMRLASLGTAVRTPFRPLPNSPITGPLTHASSISVREQERFKALQNALPQILSAEHERLFKVEYNRPFESRKDAYERLLPFHIIAHAECTMPALLEKVDMPASISSLQKRFVDYCRHEKELKVPMEIQLLENRLNLEEEKFLLQKLKTDCMNKNGQMP